jgi:hypothetical protein
MLEGYWRRLDNAILSHWKRKVDVPVNNITLDKPDKITFNRLQNIAHILYLQNVGQLHNHGFKKYFKYAQIIAIMFKVNFISLSALSLMPKLYN